MYKKVIKSIDFLGVEREEAYYFNISEAEALEMELSTTGGIIAMIQGMIDAKDMPSLVKYWKDFILASYGERSSDGVYFRKLDDEGRPLSRKFMQTDAYNKLYVELCTNTEEAINFVKNVLPKSSEEPAEIVSVGK